MRVRMHRNVIVAMATAAAACGAASAQTYSTDFENPPFGLGSINGQNGWTHTGPYVQSVSSGAAFSGTQSFHRSNNTGAGSFGDQTFSPGVGVGVGETGAVGGTAGYNGMTVSLRFRAGNTSAADGSLIGFALTDATGSRMWSINFRNIEGGGVGVVAFDVDPSLSGSGGATFRSYSVGTGLARDAWHTLSVTTIFNDGQGNDLVSISLNGGAPILMTTWEQYYRWDPEQAGNGNQLFATDRFIFRTSATPSAFGFDNSAAMGFYFDDLTYTAIPAPSAAALAGLAGLAATRRRRR